MSKTISHMEIILATEAAVQPVVFTDKVWRKQKQKKCKAPNCGKKFTPVKFAQVVCLSYECANSYGKILAAKKTNRELKRQRLENRAAKLRIKTRRQWLSEAQVTFNRYIRARDVIAGHGCIDCGKPFEPQKIGGSVDAGHYLSRGSHPNLRFNENNVHAQRKNCNRPGGTTAAAFRLGMIKRVGLDSVKILEGDTEPANYAINDLIYLKSKYAKKLAELKKLYNV